MTQLEFYTLARSLFVPSETQAARFQKLMVERYHVHVSIDDRLATTEVDLVFSNPNNVPVGGLFLFPLPDGAKLKNTEIRIDSNLTESQLLKGQKLTEFYKRVLQAQNLQMLQTIGISALQAEISPIAAEGECRVQIKYTERTAETDNGLVYTHHLRANQPVESFLMSIDIKGDSADRGIESASHNVTITRIDSENANVAYYASDAELNSDFICRYAFADAVFTQEELLLSDVIPMDNARPLTFRSPNFERKKPMVVMETSVLRSPMPLSVELSPPNGAAYHDVFFKGHGTNPFIDPEDDNLSTFGMDADSASYAVVRRYPPRR